MQNAFNSTDNETIKKLQELKSKSFSKLGVLVSEKNDVIAIEPLTCLETGLLVFDCSGVTLFISQKTIRKTGGLDLKYDSKEEKWSFAKNAYKQYIKEIPVKPEKVPKKLNPDINKPVKKASKKKPTLSGESNV